MKKENRFKVLDTMYYRRHVLDKKIELKELYTEKILNTASKNKIFMEQLEVTSPNLFQELKKYNQGVETTSAKKKKHLIESISKYYLRATYRNTPLGIFSSVGVRNMANSCSTSQQYKKKIVIGYDWIYDIWHKLINNHFDKFQYTFNNHLTEVDGSLFFLSGPENTKQNLGFKIKRSPVIDLITKVCYKKYANFNEIKQILKNSYPEVSDSFLDAYIKKLIDNNIIIPTFFLSLGKKQNEVLTQLVKITNNVGENQYVSSLKQIIHLIKKYEQSKVGNSSYFSKIKEKMNDIAPVKENSLNVDLYSDWNIVQLSQQDLDNIIKVIEFLTDISSPINILDTYIDSFIEKFGADAEVPLSVVIDPNIGIGLPKEESNEKSHIQNSTLLGVQNFFAEKIELALIKHKDIELTDTDFDQVRKFLNTDINEEQQGKIPKSFEVCFNTMINKNQVNNFYISEILGSTELFSLEGRFDDLLINAPKYKTRDIESCDINTIPSKYDYMNIYHNKHEGDSELSIGLITQNNKNDVQLNDLSIGYANEQLYIRNRKNNKIIMFNDRNMFNDNLKNPIIKFLLELNNQNTKWWFNMPWLSSFSNYCYIPAIKYKNITISPSTWIFTVPKYRKNHNTDFVNFKSEFLEFAKKFQLPNYFYYVEMDNKIICDLSTESLYVMFKETRKGNSKYILLKEIEKNLLKNPENNEDIVLEFCSNNYGLSNNKIPVLPVYDPVSTVPVNNKINGYLYFEIIFGNQRMVKNFLRSQLSEFLNRNNKLYQRYFYIQYETLDYNRQPSIRLRFYENKDENINRLENNAISWLSSLLHKSCISSFKIKNYVPEVYRYGGVTNLGLAEEIFEKDSNIALFILKNIESENQKFYILYSLITLILEGTINIDNAISFMKNNYVFDTKSFKEEKIWFRENAKSLGHLGEDLNKDFKKMIKSRGRSVKSLINKDEYKRPENMLLSLLHMNCNRILGVSRNDENDIMYLTFKTLELFKHTDKIL
ncbi:lantibiotic dehydratase [Lactobacillus bombicola]|uniref:lantibiotic dehydratase n=1 Tax=Lactobacillus bombicola TaxID=1505723 RepID=UPI000E56D62E|nr:lantibiotic dehydratase [Lactobacillus bombicola]RHW53254.1 hypothetical protein DS833_00360 [Lactobacillus bombicola]